MTVEIHRRCPSAEMLGAFVEGRLREPELTTVSAHVEECAECIAVVREAARIGPTDSDATGEDDVLSQFGSLRFIRQWQLGAAAAAVAAIAVAIVVYLFLRDPLAPLVQASGEATNRLVEPRLSGFPYRKPPVVLLGTARDLDPDLIAARGVAGTVMKQTLASSESHDLHAAGVAALIVGDSSAAVDRLTRAASAAPESATYWSDVAAAHYVRGMDDSDAHELIEAVAAADAALRLDPSCREALFNRALALDRLHLREQAVRAWTAYLRVDPSSEWAAEVRGRLNKLRQEASTTKEWRRTLDAIRGNDRFEPMLEDLVRLHPEEGRRWGEATLLAEWANAELTGDEPRARQRLDVVREIAGVLARASGERLLWDAVRVIDSCPSRQCREHLAEAHVRYDQARQIYSQRAHLSEALSLFRAATDLFRSEGSAMTYIAAYYAASCREDQSGNVEVELEKMLCEIPPGYDALRAQILWEIGTTSTRQGRAAEARRAHLEAAAIFDRLGEVNNAARMRSSAAAASSMMGRAADAWRLRWEAFSLMTSYPEAAQEALELAARMEAAEGRWRTAVSLFALALEPPRRLTPRVRFSAVVWCALAAGRIGLEDWAWRQVRDARELARRIPDSDLRSTAVDDLLFAEASLLRQRNPDRAAKMLERYIEHCAAIRRTFFVAEACLERGRAARSLGDTATALRFCRMSLAEVEKRRGGATHGAVTDVYYATATTAATEIADILESQGQVEEAFRAIERARGRLLFDVLTPHSEEPLVAADLARLLPDGTLLVEYLALGDRLLIFTIDRQLGLRRWRASIGKAALGREIEALGKELQDGRTPGAAANQLARVLIEPIESAVAGARRLVFVVDPMLPPLPLSVLPDRGFGMPLVDRFAVLHTPSAAVFARTLTRPAHVTTDDVLVIGNPAFDPRLFPSLEPLPEAEREAMSIGAKYSHTRILVGRDATATNVLQTIGSSRIAHIGAHAVVSRVDPMRSFVVLAPVAQRSGALYATDVAHIRLNATDVVVLAGCNTAGRSPVPSELNSIALAFLAGGARTVIGTLWAVEDGDAARFCDALHDELAAHVPAAEALRRTQRRLRSRLPARSIAAFIAIGADA